MSCADGLRAAIYRRILPLAFAVCAPLELRADDELGRPLCAPDACASAAGGDEPPPQYGPDPCVSRGTLFQWSYGTSFTGGPNLEEPIVTDRPDFTEASVTVGRGVTQLEAGYTYVYDSENGVSVKSHSWGEPLLRHGILADWLEFRIALFPLTERVTAAGASESTTGTADLYLGLKFALTPQEGVLPEMALVPQMTVPTGSSAFSDDEVLPGVNWLYGWDVTEVISFGGSTQFNRTVDEAGGTYTEWAQSLTVGYSLAEKLGAYTEWFAFFPAGAQTAQTEHYFDGGFTYLLSDDVQFDIRAGVGANSAAADYFLGTGLSVRFK